MNNNVEKNMLIAIAWCLAWGSERQPSLPISLLWEMCQAILENGNPPLETQEIVKQVQQLASLKFPDTLEEMQKTYPNLWNQSTKIGLVYGGATKIKSYVFESADLQKIRGASALLDRINLVDLPAFFEKKDNFVSKWLDQQFPGLREALIPELIIYSTGGNILAFCPVAFINDLANAIEKRYTEETLTANSCAVGNSFRLLELRFGLLEEPLNDTKWLNWYKQNWKNSLVKAYLGDLPNEGALRSTLENCKSFNELVGKLTTEFNQRRNGNDKSDRPTRRYPPMFETHPYLARDEGDRRSSIIRVKLPGEPCFSEAIARKHLVGQRVKRERSSPQNWYKKSDFGKWETRRLESWIAKFEKYVKNPINKVSYPLYKEGKRVTEAQRLGEIANGSNGFIALIYADGNNMGGYIQQIKTPTEYQKFSQDIFSATSQSVYRALAQHLTPHQLHNLAESDSQHREGLWVHPFEIITIGGDDVLLIVPANQALTIAHTIGVEFEKILLEKSDYRLNSPVKSSIDAVKCHRYHGQLEVTSQCSLSMSTGVLITDYATPIFYAEKLAEQLLKSAKKKAKNLKEKYQYYGGTVDFLCLKSVTMIASNIESFRQEALTKELSSKNAESKITLKLYAAPYTLYELAGLIETAKALKQSNFPKSQLYQIRSLLERGKKTAILNYLYFTARLSDVDQALLKEKFENVWCKAKTNNGNLVPWMYAEDEKIYETIWRELVDLYPFIDIDDNQSHPQNSVEMLSRATV